MQFHNVSVICIQIYICYGHKYYNMQTVHTLQHIWIILFNFGLPMRRCGFR